MDMRELKRTPLYDRHVQAGGKMVPFAGWCMPVQYARGIIHEHKAVRRGIGVFDVSHMGEIRISGPGAGDYIDYIGTNVAPRSRGSVTYTPLCYPDGGIVDDVTVYCMGEDDYVLVVNAANTSKDHEWIKGNAPEPLRVEDESDLTAQLAVQGPAAMALVADLLEPGVLELGRFKHTTVAFHGEPVVLSRTGYTGEDGCEIYMNSNLAPAMWDALITVGGLAKPEPIGLGARDTLRFEASYRLYGNDIDETTDPLEAGLGWTVKLSKGDFIGRDELVRRKEKGPVRKFVGLELMAKRIARSGCGLFAEGERVGSVTSGAFAPYLGKSLAMGYLRADLAEPGRRVEVDLRGRAAEAEVVELPFYKR